MFGTVLVLAGVGGLVYFLTQNDKDLGKEIKLKVESKNTKDEGKHKLGILKERYIDVFTEFEKLEKNKGLIVEDHGYTGSSNESIALKRAIKKDLITIKEEYLNKGIINSQEERTKRLIEFLDLLLENKIKIVGLNSVLSIYGSSNPNDTLKNPEIPLDILKDVYEVVGALLQEFKDKENDMNNRSAQKAQRLLEVLKTDTQDIELLDDINNRDEISIHLGDGRASEKDINQVSSNLKALRNNEKEWDSN